MKRFFAPNIDRQGRLVRGLMGLALLAGAAFSFRESLWLAALLAAAGVFGLFEASAAGALRGPAASRPDCDTHAIRMSRSRRGPGRARATRRRRVTV